MQSRNNSRIGAVILAAGKSSRMGEPKQLMPVDGRPILAHTLANLRAARVNEIVLVLGFAADEIRRQLELYDVKIVDNRDYEQGMSSSLRSGISALDPDIDASLVVLADQPFVRSQTLDEIISRYQLSDAQIVVPTYRGFRGNPVLLDRSVFAEVMAQQGDVGCRAVFGNHTAGIVKVEVDDIGILLDIDNQQDLARAREFIRSENGAAVFFDLVDLRGRSGSDAQEASNARGNLIIVGTEPVAVALVKLAKVLQFHVTVVDPLAQRHDVPDADQLVNSLDLSLARSGPNSYVTIASRGRFDEEAIGQALAAHVNYIALVANRKRAEDVRRRLQESGLTAEKLAVLRAPAGLDIGAATPEEIALSIMAEIVSVNRRNQYKTEPAH